ncbi:phosphoribosylaminoimidazolesuccinocarboxamide synthase [Salinicoccus sp. RF5]|uniref:phosphoribosylaminoimidazolesuccinocarboxamide synthase n=1 Tax=Salinicoccus sp. RF5 TaxID=2748874 RepID=UPI001E3EE4E7|nr:phosphoribosylaminoimidazolesuccinocarboxamide synthase [Salinicoccus sp. RF5]
MMLLYEGKAKRVFKTEVDGVYRIEYKDEVTAGNGEKHDFLEGKGRLNNLISADIFEYMASNGVDSHFVERISETEQLVRAVDIIPLEVVVRNFAAGSIVKRLGLESHQPLDPPLVEFFYKNDDLGDPILTDDHVLMLGLATTEEIRALKTAALKINTVLSRMMAEMSLSLIDFKIEFGKDQDGNIVLADEISPDTCRIVDMETKENFDKDVYRNSTGSLLDTYTAFYNKMEAIR